RRGGRAWTRRRPADRFGVLGLSDGAAPRTACSAGKEVTAATATSDTRHPAAVAATPAALRALTLRLLTALVIRELARLRALLIVARSHRTRRHRAARRERSWRERSSLWRTEALSAASSASTATGAARGLIGAGGSGGGLHWPLIVLLRRSDFLLAGIGGILVSLATVCY